MKVHLAAAAIFIISMISGCSDSDTIPEGDPARTFGDELRGYMAEPGVVIGRDLSAYWAQAALSAFRATGEEDLPAKVSLAPVIGNRDLAEKMVGSDLKLLHKGS